MALIAALHRGGENKSSRNGPVFLYYYGNTRGKYGDKPRPKGRGFCKSQAEALVEFRIGWFDSTE